MPGWLEDMQMVNLQIMIHVLRNYTYLQLSHFAFETRAR